MASLQEKDLFIFDMDGVLYRVNDPIDSGIRAVKELRKRGKKVAFLTNNSTKTKIKFLNKLETMGLKAQESEIFTAAYLSAEKLAELYPGGKVFYIGEDGLRTALESKGFKILNLLYPELNNIPQIPEDISADFVIVGMDTGLTYNKFRTAMMLILKGADFYGTNADTSFPAPGTLWPGSGAGIAFISAAVDRKPKKIFGKPEPEGVFSVLDAYGISPDKSVVVGDRLNTDIWGGNNAGVATVLVETGINSRSDAMACPEGQRPTFIFKSLDELFLNWD